MSINNIRSILYKLARLLGDINAIQKGKIGERFTRRIAGKVTSRFMNKLFRNLFK